MTSDAAIECILELPQGTLAAWRRRKKGPPAAGRALLRFLRQDPFLLEKYQIHMERLRTRPPLTIWRPLTRTLTVVTDAA